MVEDIRREENSDQNVYAKREPTGSNVFEYLSLVELHGR
jgi:hypothetical protein